MSARLSYRGTESYGLLDVPLTVKERRTGPRRTQQKSGADTQPYTISSDLFSRIPWHVHGLSSPSRIHMSAGIWSISYHSLWP